MTELNENVTRDGKLSVVMESTAKAWNQSGLWTVVWHKRKWLLVVSCHGDDRVGGGRKLMSSSFAGKTAAKLAR